MVEPLELGSFISTCRKEKNLTQKQLGEELGVTDRAVSKWENGKSFPDISLIEQLCRYWISVSVNSCLGKGSNRNTIRKRQKKPGLHRWMSRYCIKFR